MVAFCGKILALAGWNLQCLGANARGFPGVNPPGWPLISADCQTILLVKGRPLESERVKKKTSSLNPFTPKSDLTDFTLSNARRFYSSKGDPLGVKGLRPSQ